MFNSDAIYRGFRILYFACAKSTYRKMRYGDCAQNGIWKTGFPSAISVHNGNAAIAACPFGTYKIQNAETQGNLLLPYSYTCVIV